MLVNKSDVITTIGINRPQKRNCVDYKTSELLKKAIADFENDDSSPIAVLYGVGGNFCAGYDLSELSTLDVDDNANSLITETGTVVYETKIFLF